ncbi:hypothetical protein ACFWMR_19335 [Amycolatopsis thailandensis]|uniref:hypothetical protein n=1 Tax=Amycolatopsis thailandensis TaxID=589330 RepID=UPI003650AEBA
MSVSQFVAHRGEGKARVFALIRGSSDSLEVVTSLGADDAHVAEDLIRELNFFLVERDERSLNDFLGGLPNAVQIAVRNFLQKRCRATLGAMSVYGAVEPLKLLYVDSREEFRELLGAAYLIGLGFEASNEIDEDGDASWEVQLSTAEPFVRASEGERSWALPEGVSLSSTWTSRDYSGGNVIDQAVRVAESATSRGYRVCLHTFEKGDGESIDSSSTSVIVVDIFDAPIPPSRGDLDA